MDGASILVSWRPGVQSCQHCRSSCAGDFTLRALCCTWSSLFRQQCPFFGHIIAIHAHICATGHRTRNSMAIYDFDQDLPLLPTMLCCSERHVASPSHLAAQGSAKYDDALHMREPHLHLFGQAAVQFGRFAHMRVFAHQVTASRTAWAPTTWARTFLCCQDL